MEGDLIILAPNPANNYLTITSTLNKGQVTVTSISGQEISSIAINSESTTIDVSSWANGIYNVRVLNNSGVIIKTEKVVIAH